MKRTLTLVFLLWLPLAASAATWQVCHLHVRIVNRLTAPYPSLQAKVLDVQTAPSVSDCPVTGAIITFSPETPDYQSTLPRRRWPKVGETIKMRYQYLDGICKGDGNSYQCRIEHYPTP